MPNYYINIFKSKISLLDDDNRIEIQLTKNIKQVHDICFIDDNENLEILNGLHTQSINCKNPKQLFHILKYVTTDQCHVKVDNLEDFILLNTIPHKCIHSDIVDINGLTDQMFTNPNIMYYVDKKYVEMDTLQKVIKNSSLVELDYTKNSKLYINTLLESLRQPNKVKKILLRYEKMFGSEVETLLYCNTSLEHISITSDIQSDYDEGLRPELPNLFKIIATSNISSIKICIGVDIDIDYLLLNPKITKITVVSTVKYSLDILNKNNTLLEFCSYFSVDEEILRKIKNNQITSNNIGGFPSYDLNVNEWSGGYPLYDSDGSGSDVNEWCGGYPLYDSDGSGSDVNEWCGGYPLYDSDGNE